MKAINLTEKFDLFNDYWNPKIVAEFNDQHIKLVKVKGEFVWHNHKDEDELFFVIKGKLKIAFQEEIVEINEGEMLIVPKGIDHKPMAAEEVLLMLIEPNTIKHTGDIQSDLTIKNPERI